MAKYIDAELLKEVILGWMPQLDDEQLEYEIDTMPTVDVAEVKRGKWTDAYVSGVHHYRCTNCGEYIEATWTANFDYNYCPNCGADMRGGKA